MQPRTQGFVLALPVLAMALELIVSLIGGRLMARFGRSPMVATAIGWAVFLIAVGVAYEVA
ncbi:MAG: hypothetical protein H0V92_12865 [Pseudonocardiales bacterium]|nr:hypothetical protein [Pseudonocardiales bacterium]